DIAASQMGRQVSLGHLNAILGGILREARPDGALGDAKAKNLVTDISAFRTAMTGYQTQMAEYLKAQDKIGGIIRVEKPSPQNVNICAAINELALKLDSAAFRFVEEAPEKNEYLKNQAEILREIAEDLESFFRQIDPEWAYWLESAGHSKEDVLYCREPVDASEMLAENLFGNCDEVPVIVTSATLAVNDSMDFFRKRIGADNAKELILDTPFNYETQVTLHLPPMPRPDSREYEEYLLAMLKHYIPLTQGRAFVLFTSHAQLKRTTNQLLTFLLSNDYVPIIQDGSMPPGQMLETFKKTRRAVLFGTDTFWTGVDVPGDALSSVIITKLPFGQYGHPVQVTRDIYMQNRGMNMFAEHSLPEAILKFRQGCGRLIRTRDDSGIIVVLDGRLHTTQYGKLFINALPKCNISDERPEFDVLNAWE
ncbi:MAG: hypothetical protein J6S21_01095, partial [Victivallales bacterium]|nr:hypothetical protein [Victivallales bacterium]